MRVALDQWRPVTGGKAEGLARLDVSAAKAKALGADVLILPEMALTGYNIGVDAVKAAAEPVGGGMTVAMAAVARRHGVAVLAGMPESDGGSVYNAAVLVGADGGIVAACRKTHLYGGVDRALFTAGDALSPVVDFLGLKVALAICYDVEFPELVRSLALAGAEALLVPTANMHPYTGIPLRLVPSRAEENEVFVAYANYTGGEGAFAYCGLSCVIAPDGSDLARAGFGEEMVSADLSRDRLTATRATLSHLADRRPDLYRLTEGDRE